jgi:hypothetical protein
MIDLVQHKRVQALCYEVGYVTIVWAAIDTQFDVLNLALKRHFGGHPNWAELPRTRLNSKIKCARACLTHISAVDALRERGLDIVDQVELLSEERHWLIHGVAGEITEETPSLTLIDMKNEQYEDRPIKKSADLVHFRPDRVIRSISSSANSRLDLSVQAPYGKRLRQGTLKKPGFRRLSQISEGHTEDTFFSYGNPHMRNSHS